MATIAAISKISRLRRHSKRLNAKLGAWQKRQSGRVQERAPEPVRTPDLMCGCYCHTSKCSENSCLDCNCGPLDEYTGLSDGLDASIRGL